MFSSISNPFKKLSGRDEIEIISNTPVRVEKCSTPGVARSANSIVADSLAGFLPRIRTSIHTPHRIALQIHRSELLQSEPGDPALRFVLPILRDLELSRYPIIFRSFPSLSS
jgi:hypothetical protein